VRREARPATGPRAADRRAARAVGPRPDRRGDGVVESREADRLRRAASPPLAPSAPRVVPSATRGLRERTVPTGVAWPDVAQAAFATATRAARRRRHGDVRSTNTGPPSRNPARRRSPAPPASSTNGFWSRRSATKPSTRWSGPRPRPARAGRDPRRIVTRAPGTISYAVNSAKRSAPPNRIGSSDGCEMPPRTSRPSASPRRLAG